MRAALFSSMLLLAVTVCPTAAHAQVPAPPAPSPPHRDMVRFEYTTAPGTRCPDDHAAQDMLQGELGYDAVRDEAELTLSVEATRQGRELRVVVALRDAAGVVFWTRMHQDRETCAILLERAIVSASLGLGELRWAREEAPASPPSPPPPPPVVPPVAAPIPPPPVVPRPILFQVGTTARAEVRTGGRPAFGLTLDAGVRFGWFSVAGEFHWVPSAGTTTANGVEVANTSFFAGALVACGRLGQRVVVLGCLVGEAGAIERKPAGSLGGVGHALVPSAGGGARGGVEVPLTSPVYLQVSADLIGVANQSTKLHGAAVVPGGLVGGLAGAFGAGLGASF
jgi:hypothetical protein